MYEKVGIVTSIYPERCTARVKFEDNDDLISAELQLVVRGTLKNMDYWMPRVDEHVLCIFTEQKMGYILGAVYSEKSQPPVQDDYKRHLTCEDGAVFEYDTKTHTLLIDCPGPINIIATGNINVTGDVIADGISLKHHIHPGTGEPVGGG